MSMALGKTYCMNLVFTLGQVCISHIKLQCKSTICDTNLLMDFLSEKYGKYLYRWTALHGAYVTA